MELKQITFIKPNTLSEVLIVPSGIETSSTALSAFAAAAVLIVPSGIETCFTDLPVFFLILY